MKKHTKILIITLSIVLLLVLFCPYRKSVALDGGSTFYSAGLYEVVKWNSNYVATRIYWFPDNFKSYNELMEIEKARDDYEEYLRFQPYKFG